MTIKRYLSDASLTGEVTVKDINSDGRTRIRLKETPFHVQGGGQKADRGTIGGVAIVDVRYAEDGEVDHFVEGVADFEVGRCYGFEIDPEWRNLNAGYHSAGHLLAAVCEAMFPGIHASAGHQWPGEARVDFTADQDASELFSKMIESGEAIQARVREEIARSSPVRIVGDPYSSRACQIGNYPPVPCGGTHVLSTAEIGRFSIRSIKGKNNALVRVGYEL